MDNIIGIDVTKDTLDVHRLADGSHCQIPNSTTGHTKLLKWIEARSTALVVFQATAAYHRQLEQRLSAKAVPFIKVNPKQARRFTQASGKLAKTDRVDSEMLAKMGVALQLKPKLLICTEK
jgi:transposase